MDKYAHQYKVRDQQTYMGRFGGNRMKEYVLTWGDLHNHAWLSEEVTETPAGRYIVGKSNEPMNESDGITKY